MKRLFRVTEIVKLACHRAKILEHRVVPWHDSFEPFILFRRFVKHLTPLAVAYPVEFFLAVLKNCELRASLHTLEVY